MKDEELPEWLRRMSADERRKYLAAQAEEREDLTRQLAVQVKQRDDYIRAKTAEGAAAAPVDSFDVNVTNALKKQIK